MKITPILLQFKRSSINSEVTVFKDFLFDLNYLAAKEKEKLNSMVKEIIATNPEDEYEIHDYFSEQYGIYDSKYIELANNGMLVNAYSFFEHQLKDISRMFDRFLTVKVGTYRNQPSLSYAENTCNEIAAMTGLDLSNLQPVYDKIDEYRKIRNLMVHNGSSLIETIGTALISQRNYSLVSSKQPEISINPNNGDFYVVDKQFVLDFLDLVENYLTEIIKKFEQIN